MLSWACQTAVLCCVAPVGHWLDATTVINHVSGRGGGIFWAEVPGICHASAVHLMLPGIVTSQREVERLLYVLPSGQGISPEDQGVQDVAQTHLHHMFALLILWYPNF